MKPAVIECPSPNFGDRAAGVPLRYIVLHYTGMPSGEAALARMLAPQAEVSAHYMIEEDGRIFRLVDEDKRAWHAGRSFWRGITDLNSASIGIEIVNPGHEFGYRPFPATQIAALKELLRDIIARRGLDARTCLLAHSDIAPARKEDPGELFPWRELAKEGLGLWPEPQIGDADEAGDGELRQLLHAIGYDCPETKGTDDEALRAVLRAFQRRYEPDNATGIAGRETFARLKALVRSAA